MSPARSATRPGSRPARGQSRRRRWGWIAVAALLGVGLAIGISRIDVQKAIRELTLPLQHDDIIRQQAAEKNLDPAMIAAVIYAESRFRDQESHAGALGLMQITPETAQVIEHLSGGTTFVTSDLSDPEINIRYGSAVSARSLRRQRGSGTRGLQRGDGERRPMGSVRSGARRHPVSRDARLRRGGARQTQGVSRPVRPGSGASQPMKPHRGGWGGRPR